MLNSRASTFKVSCEHEVKVYECKLVEKRSMKMTKKRVVSLTLRPRQAPCSKELCSFRTPKTIYEQFLNSSPNLAWGCPVSTSPNQTPINSSSTTAKLSIFSLFFFPPPSSSPFSPFLSPIIAGRWNKHGTAPPLLHPYTLHWNFLLRGKWLTGEGLCRAGVDTMGGGGQRVDGWRWKMRARRGDSGFSVRFSWRGRSSLPLGVWTGRRERDGGV